MQYDLVENTDSITFCLSKGLSSPIGSIICGTEKFIYYARRIRKALGGGMRQAGIIAAAGIISIEKMIDQIKKDHLNASLLKSGINNIEGLYIDIENIKTNIIYFDLEKGSFRSKKLLNQTKGKTVYPLDVKMNNVYFLEISPNRFRLVTHHGINEEDIEKILIAVEKIVE